MDGFYRSRDSRLVVRLGSRDGLLQILDRDEKIALRTDGEGHFLLPGSIDPGHFEPTEGRAQRLVVQGEGKPAETWDRLPAYPPASGVPKDFAGGYYSEELDTSYVIEDREGRLFLTRKKYPANELIPLGRDLFVSFLGDVGPGQTVIQFTRGSSGRVSGMRLTTGRVRDLRFVRQKSAQ
jgi:hypothetical protein